MDWWRQRLVRDSGLCFCNIGWGCVLGARVDGEELMFMKSWVNEVLDH